MGTELFAILALISLCFLVATGTFLSIWWWKTKKHEHIARGFTTSHGIHVKPTKITKFLTSEIVEQWSEEIIAFWCNKMDWDPYIVENSMKDSILIFKDTESLPYPQKDNKYARAYGIAYPYNKVIEMSSLGRGIEPFKLRAWIRFLFLHEISHIILTYVGGVAVVEGGNAAHKIFDEVELWRL